MTIRELELSDTRRAGLYSIARAAKASGRDSADARDLAAHPAGDQRPDCPVLDGGGDASTQRRRAGDADVQEHSILSQKRLERGSRR